ncbi:MAG: amidohydrolase [Endomicrobium sp.]|jgi:5-methylthioadenosine/S-adenosylhomocysteine deaminase|nr:amidohydrolase [Endomicrobium sp.]
MNIRFYNGLVCAMLDKTEIIEGQEVWIQDNKISYIGHYNPSEFTFDREIDLKGNLIMPGFKNAHAHSGMTFLRSYADDLPLIDWLNHKVFPIEAKLKEEHVYYFNLLGILEYLTSGITSVMDMYFFQDEMVQASLDVGFRSVLVSGINGDNLDSVKKMEENYLRFNGSHDLISALMGFHAEYTSSKELIKEISKTAARYKASVYTHNSESKREVGECIERTGMTPTQYLNSLGIFDNGGGCFHCVHLSQEDFEIFKQKKIAVVTCPASNCKLSSGIAQVEKMVNFGIRVALGTDGHASNNALDMFREMYLTTALQKVITDNASAMDPIKVLEMITKVGANIMGLTDCDSLAPGKLADLIVIDLHQPNMQPLNDILKNLVYSGSKQNIKLTMINGKILYEDGKFNIGIDPEEIYKEVNKIKLYLVSNL